MFLSFHRAEAAAAASLRVPATPQKCGVSMEPGDSSINTPTTSLISQVSSNPMSIAFDVSGLDDNRKSSEMLLSREFYNHVKSEREKLQVSSTSSRGFRWTDLKVALQKRHPYFQKVPCKKSGADLNM